MSKVTTVAQLREFIAALPDDCEVEVLREYSGSYYTATEWVPVDLDKYSDNCDVIDLGTRKILYLGEG